MNPRCWRWRGTCAIERGKAQAGRDKDEMEEDFYSRMRSKAAAGRNSGARAIVGAALAAFLLGAAVTGLTLWNYGLGPFGEEGEPASAGQADGPAQLVLATPTPVPSEAAAEDEAKTSAAAAVQAVEMVASQQGGIEARVTAMEQRLTALDLQAQAAYGNAARAEALLVAFATRRAIERGTPLGYLEEQIKVRFEDGFPNAVAAILAAAERPVTLDKLRARLDGLAPQLLADSPEESGWEWFKREIGELFIIRKESTPSPAPSRRLDRARIFLETGQIENAIAEVRQMPGADSAGQWIADAERYAAALRGLDRLETSAIVGGEGVKDITGTPAVPAARSGA